MKQKGFPRELAREFCAMNWLRPENVVWDTKAAMLFNEYSPRNPCLDLGSGNGLTMFVAAGGIFADSYDWYLNTDTSGFLNNADIYDVCTQNTISSYIIKNPPSFFDCAFDHKENLLAQAAQLNGFYRRTECGDAQERLPFADGEFLDVYSNILYWIEQPERTLSEIFRIIRPGGRLIAAVPTDLFFDYCPTYHYAKAGKYAGILKMLNRGRADSHKWAITADGLEKACSKLGMRLLSRKQYLSADTLLAWDIGLRPLSPLLIKMANALSAEERVAQKREWIDYFMAYAEEMWKLEEAAEEREKGFALVVFEKPESLDR